MGGGYAVGGLPWRVPLNATKLSLFRSSSYVLYLESTIVAFSTDYSSGDAIHLYVYVRASQQICKISIIETEKADSGGMQVRHILSVGKRIISLAYGLLASTSCLILMVLSVIVCAIVRSI
jgi:hypothetical protein